MGGNLKIQEVTMQHDQTIKLPNRTWLVAGLLTALIIIAATLPLRAQAVAGFNSKRDCDDNAVIHCGAMDVNEVNVKYDADASIQAIYAYFGITKSSMTALQNSVELGKVTKDGRVLVAGNVVATDAITAGRTTMPGSTTASKNGVTFYTRPPSVSFMNNELDAFVYMDQGEFKYAVIASCGNPVAAKPPAHPAKPTAPTPTPPPPAPTPTPPAPTPPAPTPTPTPPAPTPPAPTPTPPTPPTMPATGVGTTAVGLFTAFTTAGAAAHQVYSRKRLI
jgi:hypothetical protein